MINGVESLLSHNNYHMRDGSCDPNWLVFDVFPYAFAKNRRVSLSKNIQLQKTKSDE